MRQHGIRMGAPLLCALAMCLLVGCGAVEEAPTVTDGRLDASAHDFSETLALQGTWLARAGVDSAAFAEYAYDASHWDTVSMPALFEHQGYPEEGLVWYRVHLRVPERPLGGFARPAMNAGRLYAARPGYAAVELGGNGRPALSGRVAGMNRSFTSFALPADTALVLTWKVANHDYLNGGPVDAIVIGDADRMERRAFLRRSFALLVVGLYLMLGVTFLLYWVWHRANVAALTVSLLAFTAALRSLTVESLLEPAMPDLSFHTRIALEGVTFFALVALLYAAFWAFSPKEFLPLRIAGRRFMPPDLNVDLSSISSIRAQESLLARSWRTLNTASLIATSAVSGAFMFAVCIVPVPIQSRLMAQFRWFSLAVIGMSVLLLVQIVHQRRPAALGLVLGYGLMVAAGIHDILVSQGWILLGNPPLAPSSLLGFMLLQSFMVARRSARHAEFVRHHASILEAEVGRQTNQLLTATAAAQQANDAKSRFLAAITHELRTPLSGIIGFADLLKENLEEQSMVQERRFADLIETSGRRLLTLVNDLLDMAKAESGRLTLHIESVSLDPVVDEVYRQMHPLAWKAGLTFEVRRHAAGLNVSADGVRLQQVLINLVSNAVKFTKEGRVAIEIDHGTLPGPRPAAALRIVDTGQGIQSDFLPHLFDRFTQQDQGTGSGGTGLGLAITHELVSRMDGSIHVESEPRHGSTFTVLLPLADEEVVEVSADQVWEVPE